MNIQGIDYTSCYINQNTRQLTSNRNNTAWVDEGATSFMYDKLRPVKDIVTALNTPLNLADETYIDKANNEIYIAEGTHLRLKVDLSILFWKKELHADMVHKKNGMGKFLCLVMHGMKH